MLRHTSTSGQQAPVPRTLIVSTASWHLSTTNIRACCRMLLRSVSARISCGKVANHGDCKTSCDVMSQYASVWVVLDFNLLWHLE